MSNDLIRRSALIKKFEEAKEKADTLRDIAYLTGVLAIIDCIPTAYDVDAVCEEILFWIGKKEKEAIAINENSLFPCEGFMPAILTSELKEILEIVRNGGMA